MTPLSDAAVARLRSLDDIAVFVGSRYEVRGELGRGGMGVVYRVHDNALGRDVALKVVAPGSAGPDAGIRLRREAQALARLEHPGIVPVHDVGQLADDRVYYAMKLNKRPETRAAPMLERTSSPSASSCVRSRRQLLAMPTCPLPDTDRHSPQGRDYPRAGLRDGASIDAPRAVLTARGESKDLPRSRCRG